MIAFGKTAAIAMALIAAGTALPALAQEGGFAQDQEITVTGRRLPAPDVLTRAVPIGDLDLKTSEGQEAMDRRVSEAIRSMCAVPAAVPGYEAEMSRPCSDEAWVGARLQMMRAINRAWGVSAGR